MEQIELIELIWEMLEMLMTAQCYQYRGSGLELAKEVCW